MNRLAIFDCDGTLVDSGATIRAALEQAFAAHGVECPPAEVTRKVIGLSLMESMAALAPDGDHAALTQSYKQAFFAMRAAGRVEEPLFDGGLGLDSIDGLELGMALRQTFGVKIESASEEIRRHFATVQSMARFVASQTGAR